MKNRDGLRGQIASASVPPHRSAIVTPQVAPHVRAAIGRGGAASSVQPRSAPHVENAARQPAPHVQAAIQRQALPTHTCSHSPQRSSGTIQMLKIAGQKVTREVRSREGTTVFFAGSYVYKVFGNGAKAYDECGRFKDAEQSGVPVPEAAKCTVEMDDEMGQKEMVHAVRSRLAPGTFFQFSKPGGMRTLLNAIGQSDDVRALRNLRQALVNASAAGIMDPQGFINLVREDQPVLFIDIHMRGTPNLAFDEPIAAIDQRISEL